MTKPVNPTVATLQTAAGAGGIAVILLAGPRTLEIISQIFRGRGGENKGQLKASPQRLLLGDLHEGGNRLDEADPAPAEPARQERPPGRDQHSWRPAHHAAGAAAPWGVGGGIAPAGPETVEKWGLWNLVGTEAKNPAIVVEMLEGAAPKWGTFFACWPLMHQVDAGLSELAQSALCN